MLIAHEELSKMPDLNICLKEGDAVTGKIVDLVPRYGNVTCMTTKVDLVESLKKIEQA